MLKALTLDKSQQTGSCEKWLKQLDFAVKGYRKWLYISCAAMIVIVANLVYIQEVAKPEISIVEMTQENQLSFANNMDEALLALEFGDINGALFYLDKAYFIHSQNEEVTSLIATILERVSVALSEQQSSIEEKAELLNTLQQYPAFSNREYFASTTKITIVILNLNEKWISS